MRRLIYVLALLYPSLALADSYEVGGGFGGQVSIYNVDTRESINLNLAEILNFNNPYGALDPDGPDDNTNEVFYDGGMAGNVDENSETDINGLPKIKDIRGNQIFLEKPAEALGVSFNGGETVYLYGRRAVYDMESNQLVQDVLIAYSDESYQYAIDNGYQAELRGSGVYPTNYSFQSVSTNFLNDGITNGGLQTDVVYNSNGESMIRTEDDGTVHIGVNSFVFAEAGTAGFQHDTLYSSLGTLQLGNNSNHRTIVKGTLEIEEPTAPNHAATKNYVDDSAALAMAMTALPRSYNGKTVVGVAGGHSGDNSAFALGISKSEIGGNVQFNLNLGYSESTSFAGAAGVGWEF